MTADFTVGDYMPLAHAEVDAALAAGQAADRGRGDRPLPAGGAGRALAGQGAAEAEDSELWSPETRHPTTIFGLDMDRAQLYERIDARTEAIVAAGAAEEARRADALGPARTARKALGFDELLAGDVEAMKKRSRNYARRQLTWMRKIPNLAGDRPHAAAATREVAAEIAARLGSPPMKFEKWQALGNDYLILEAQNLPWELNPKRVEWLCDPHFGVGSDGVLLLARSEDPEFVADAADLQPGRLGGRALRQRRPRGDPLPAPARLDRRGRASRSAPSPGRSGRRSPAS